MAAGKNGISCWTTVAIIAMALLFMCPSAYGQQKGKEKKKTTKQLPPVEHKEYRVEGGVMQQVKSVITDSAQKEVVLPKDSISADSLSKLLSAREQRRLKRAQEDTVARYSYFFRDTLPLSRMTAISLVVPGFSQLHNKQYWKIPLAYGSLAGTIAGYMYENRKYSGYRDQYDALIAGDATREQIDPVQTRMIQYNTRRQLFMAGIYVSWVYFICDGAINYPGTASSVKKATTLSTILPGAGQIYNRSYWKVPILLGGFATMGYVIDWNNRLYNRYKLAYDLVMANKPDEFDGKLSPDFLRNSKNNARRNRDLCIIISAGLYVLNIIDAHVDSQLKDYDVSDNLAMNLQPTIIDLYSMGGQGYAPGLSFTLRF